jgi:hypothetical protein
VGTVNVGYRAPASLSFIWRCVRGGPLPHNGRRLRSGRVSDRFPDPEIIPGDHIPTTLSGGCILLMSSNIIVVVPGVDS